MQIRCAIIDDEPMAIGVLEGYAEKLSNLKVEGSFTNAVKACEFLAENPVDLIFLDVNMPVMDGFELLQCLDKKPMVVITSAHEEYALKGFEFEAVDYLVKPIPLPRFIKTVNRITGLLSQPERKGSESDRESIFVRIDNKRLQKIYLNDILVVESLKDYIRIKTDADKYIIHKTLSSFTEELPQDRFMRIHRSFTVAVDKIERMEGNSVIVDGIRLNIGRSYLNDVKERILKHSI